MDDEEAKEEAYLVILQSTVIPQAKGDWKEVLRLLKQAIAIGCVNAEGYTQVKQVIEDLEEYTAPLLPRNQVSLHRIT